MKKSTVVMEKLIFKKPSTKKIDIPEQPRVRLNDEAFEVVETIAIQTGLNRSYIASQIIAFASKHIEVVEG